jgi:hypothetical protein
LDHGDVIVAAAAGRSFKTPLANDATQLSRAQSIQGAELGGTFPADHALAGDDDLAPLDEQLMRSKFATQSSKLRAGHYRDNKADRYQDAQGQGSELHSVR